MTSEPIVVLLRAVNVGGRKVAMARLRELLEGLGASGVSTYIQSGNIICTPPADLSGPADACDSVGRSDTRLFAHQVENLIASEFGVATTAVIRTGEELRSALDSYPFDIVEPRFAAISFLESDPDPAAATALTERDFGEDRCAVIGREIYLRYAAGTHASKITPALLTKSLGGLASTARNLRTVQKLAELAG